MKIGSRKEQEHKSAERSKHSSTTATGSGCEKNLPGADNGYIWDGQNVLFETYAETLYTLEPETYGNLISQSGESKLYFVFDTLGSTRLLINIDGSTPILYDAFGQDVVGASPADLTSFTNTLGRKATTGT